MANLQFDLAFIPRVFLVHKFIPLNEESEIACCCPHIKGHIIVQDSEDTVHCGSCCIINTALEMTGYENTKRKLS